MPSLRAPFDYLTKPVEPERLQATLAQVKERIASKTALMTQEQLKGIFEDLKNGFASASRWDRTVVVELRAPQLMRVWRK